MSRYDKYDPKVGGFRAPLAADWVQGNVDKLLGVSLDANGRVVVGTAGNSGFVGVIVLTKARKAGSIVDVMTGGECVEFPGDAGTTYYSAEDGTISDTVSPYKVGHTVEEDRLVVRTQLIPEAVAP